MIVFSFKNKAYFCIIENSQLSHENPLIAAKSEVFETCHP